EEGEGLQRLDRGTDARRGLLGVVRATVNYFEAKIAGTGGHELRGQFLCGSFHRTLVRADDGINVLSFAGGFRFHQRVKRVNRFSTSISRLTQRLLSGNGSRILRGVSCKFCFKRRHIEELGTIIARERGVERFAVPDRV